MGNCLIHRAGTSASKPIYLYNLGDECNDITGGWIGSGSNYTKNNDNLYFGKSSAGVGLGQFITSSSIDFSSYSALYIDFSSSTNADGRFSDGFYVLIGETQVGFNRANATQLIWYIPLENSYSGQLTVRGQSSYQYYTYGVTMYRLWLLK